MYLFEELNYMIFCKGILQKNQENEDLFSSWITFIIYLETKRVSIENCNFLSSKY